MLAAVLGAMTMGGCDSADCALNNNVLCTIGFYDGNGNQVQVDDTLMVSAAGTDSILYNRGVRTSTFSIPLSYRNACDTLAITVWCDDWEMEDLLYIEKTNVEHFEALECPVNMFHRITAVRSTNYMIDSVKIAYENVEYNNGENIKIFLHTAQ